MVFWKTIICRWDEEELKKWTSFRKTMYLLLPFLVYLAVHDIVQIMLWAVMEWLITSGRYSMVSELNRNAATIEGLVNGFAIMAGMAAILPVVKNELQWKRSFTREKSLAAEEKSKKVINTKEVTSYVFLAILAFCMAVSINIFFYQTGFAASSQAYEAVYQAQYGVQFVIGIVLYGILSPLAEEAVFRGLIYNRMKRCFGFPLAMIFSSLLFGLYHGNQVQAVYGLLLGLVMAYIYELYGQFRAPVVFHAVANISVYILTYENNLVSMDSKIALAIGAILLAAAIGIVAYLKKKHDQSVL